MKKQGGKMRTRWSTIVIIVVVVAMMVYGAVLVYYNNNLLGLILELAGAAIALTWGFWPDIRNWFKSRKKG